MTAPMSGCLQTGLRMAGTILLGLLVMIGLFGTIASAVSFSPWVVAWAALTVGSIWAFLRVGRPAARSLAPGAPWDAQIRAAIAQLPAGTSVHRSSARTASWAARVASVILVMGLLGGCMVLLAGGSGQESDPRVPGYESLALACVGVAGFVAGALFALARDSRGRRTGLAGGLAIPAGLAVWVLFADTAEDSATAGERILGAGMILLAVGLPVLVGFGAMQLLVGLYRRSRATVLPLGPATAVVDPRLEAITDHGRHSVLLRKYSYGDRGEADFRDDERELAASGYAEVAVCRRLPDLFSSDEGEVQALFVQAGLARSIRVEPHEDAAADAGPPTGGTTQPER